MENLLMLILLGTKQLANPKVLPLLHMRIKEVQF